MGEYELRAFQRVNTEPALQLRFVYDLLRMHAAMVDGLLLQKNDGTRLFREARLEAAEAIANTLSVFDQLYSEWRERDSEAARLVDMILEDPLAEQSSVKYVDWMAPETAAIVDEET